MNIIVLGPQGSGKGTQGKQLAKKYYLPHISTGSMLRRYVAAGGTRAEEVRELMDSGELIDDLFLEEILEERLAQPDCKNGFVLDGTPRDLEQARMLDRFISVDYAFLIDISEEESLRRVAKRAEIEHREDDTPEALKKRLATYTEKTLPVLDYYERQGILYCIDGEQKVHEVFANIVSVLEETA
ncbi:MAG: adenylate kinase family protein [Candidatus Woesearchaeota archaeon]